MEYIVRVDFEMVSPEVRSDAFAIYGEYRVGDLAKCTFGGLIVPLDSCHIRVIPQGCTGK